MLKILEYLKNKHFSGPGNISDVLKIALPAIISQMTATIMMFTDRLFMSKFGGEYLAAIFIGGFTLYAFFWIFWIYTCGYTNAIVAQHFGAKKYDKCSIALTQSFIVACIAGVIVILVAPPLAKLIFNISNHAPRQIALELEYLKTLSYGTLIYLLQVSITSFFIGIGKPNISMRANIIGMLINIPLNYVLVFGKLGFPELKIKGVAIATIISTFIVLLIMLSKYLSSKNVEKYKISKSFVFDKHMFFKLLKYGLPGGFEMFINMASLNIFMIFFMSYGILTATASSIMHSWNLLAFVPILGLNQGIISLVGQSIGSNHIEKVSKIVNSGVKIALFYISIIATAYLLIPKLLISVFLSSNIGSDYSQLLHLCKGFMRLSIFFIIAEALYMIHDGALRGAGDTPWVMRVTTSLTVAFVLLGISFIKMEMHCFSAWSVFIFWTFSMFLALFFRFKIGKWKEIKLLS
ncbi:MATE family efflux transporter [bacterium]